jgi:hypothetical protein
VAQVRVLEQKLAAVSENLKFLQPDQKKALESTSKSRNKGVTWSTETVRIAFQIRFLTGVHGYDFVRSLGYPLPSYRTLCDRVQKSEFRPGIQHDILTWLTAKMEGMRDQERDVVLMLDEMQINKALEYDKSLNIYLGQISDKFAGSNSNSVDLASHALVFMIRGLTSNWKQIVAYYLTGASMSGSALWLLTKEIIESLSSSKINVRAVVSDMGSGNRAMWKVAGIVANRKSLKSGIQHPSFHDQELYFFADIPHLLKNIRNSLQTNDIILPDDTVHDYGLNSNAVTLSHVYKLVELQDNMTFKLAPSLSSKHVYPKQFEKMNVKLAAQLLSHSTASALRYAVQQNMLPADALTTAWFLDLVNSWFDAANARSRCEALYAKSGNKINSLLQMLDIMAKLKFLNGRLESPWKPIQTGLSLF